MKNHIRKALELFCIQFSYYLLITINYRAVALLNYSATFITDILIASLVFSSIQKVAKAETNAERFAYITGGAIGATIALKLSTYLL